MEKTGSGGIPPGKIVAPHPAEIEPERVGLRGRFITVEPLDPGRHARDLFELSHGPGIDPGGNIWTYLGYGPFESFEPFLEWQHTVRMSDDPLFYALVPADSGRASGMASYLRIDPPNGVAEVGNIWFAPVLQQTRAATEAMYLMARYVFEQLGYRRYEWKCNSFNEPSRRAAKRYGFTYEGLFRQHLIVKGRNRDTTWFSMLDSEWPAIKANFEAWLDDANFDADGRQKTSLMELNAGD